MDGRHQAVEPQPQRFLFRRCQSGSRFNVYLGRRMMRRRIAAKGTDLCLFCSLRRTIDTFSLRGSGSHHARTYIPSNIPLRRPFGAVAAEKDDEEDPRSFRTARYTNSSPAQPQTPRYDQQRGSYDRYARPGDPGYRAQRIDIHDQFPRRISPSTARHANEPLQGRSNYGPAFDPAPTQQQRPNRQQMDNLPARNQLPRSQNTFSGFDALKQAVGARDDGREDRFSMPRRTHQPQNNNSGFNAFNQALGAAGNERGGRPSYRQGPRSQNNYSGFDAFSQAVRATGNERAPPMGNGYGPRSGPDRGRPMDRGRFGEPNQNFGPRARRPGPFSGRTNAPAEAGSDDAVMENSDPSIIDNSIDDVDTRRRADRAPKRTGRSDRYAAGGDEDVAAQSSSKKGKPAKKRMTQAERDMERLEEELEERGSERKKPKKKAAPRPVELNVRRLEIPEFISVQNMSQALGLRLETFMDKLEEEGFEDARHDHLLDSGTAAMFAELYGFEPVLATSEAQQDLVARPPAEDPTMLPPRPPIVTIMGHVDHGKTTILDYLRKANVVASEHGGITQHIGAFSVTMPGTQRKITFLDTPGHAAFLDMRRRGANVTDIVVLVVAADDSVKPQTEEAIKHALEANVHVIVAINKVDKEDANIDKVKQDLSRHNIIVEDYGGDYQAIPLSGKTGQGMDLLEEAITTLADVSDFRAETDGPAEGWIIESKVTLAGRVATVLVRRGTLRPGDFIVAGNTWARVRTLHNDQGEAVTEAPPGTPVQIDGWRGEDPTAGLEVLQADNEQHAKDVVDLRLEKTEALRNATDMAAINATRSEAADARAKVLEWQKEQGFASRKQARIRLRDTQEGWVETEKRGGAQKVHFVIKADVAGSTEALEAAVSAIGNSEVQANVIHSGTGQLTESDIRLLATSGEVGYAINFNQQVDGTMYRLAEAAGLEIIDHNVIYKVTDLVTEKVAAELPPLITYKVLGEAEIGQIFDVTIKKTKHKIAGCRVTNGTISRSQKVRVLRGENVVYTGTLDSLKNVKKDVNEMRKGTECGMAFDGWEDMREGDRVQCFEEMSEKRKLY